MTFDNIKPFQLILLVVFGFLIVLGLILFSTFGGFGSTKTSVGEVRVWGTLPQSGMDAVLSGLRSSSPDYAGVYYEEKSEDTFDADLAEALASGNGPDLIVISQELLATEQNKLAVIPFSTISERTFISTYLPIHELFLAEDGTYGIPFLVDPVVLYYNRSLLAEGGVAVPPTSWEAMTSLAGELTIAGGGSIARSVIPFGAYENVENSRALVSLLLLQAGNPITSVGEAGIRGRLTDTSSATSAASPAQSALSFYVQFADPIKTIYTWNRALPSARQSFLAGTLVFYPGFASELPTLKAANPNLDFDMAAIPQPQTSSQKVTFGKAYAFAIPKASNNASGALRASVALADPSLAQLASQAFYMAPATRASLTPTSNDRYAPVFFPQALIAKAWLSPSPATTDRIFSTMITSITSGSANAGQALGTANQAINASY